MAFSEFRKAQGEIAVRLNADARYTRHSEGAFLRLTDGRIMYAYSRFTGSAADDAPSDIVAIYSSDEGVTWSEAVPLLYASDFNTHNIMSVSMIRRLDGSLGLFFGGRQKEGGEHFLAVSHDESKTFDTFYACHLKDRMGYYVLNNDRVLRLASGRLVMPMAFHRGGYDSQHKDELYFETCSYLTFRLSDDDGVTWCEAPDKVFPPFSHTTSGLQEPGVVEFSDGRLLCFARTDQMLQYFCWSFDGGLHWTPAYPSAFTSPNSPIQIKKNDYDGSYLAVWNPIPNYNGRKVYKGMHGRTPIVCARSTDEGTTWSAPYLLEGEEASGYCYPAIFFTNDGHALISYCSGRPETGDSLADSSIFRLSLDTPFEGNLEDGMRKPF